METHDLFVLNKEKSINTIFKKKILSKISYKYLGMYVVIIWHFM